MENIRRTKPDDEINISSLLDEAFGPGRLARSVYRLREIRPFIDEYSYVYLKDSKIAASISYSETYINNLFKGLLLGPLAVSPALKGKGHGKELVQYTINKIELSNIYDFIIVVGDLDYYSKFEFNNVEKNLEFYGPVDKDKVLIKLIGTKININDIEQYKFT